MGVAGSSLASVQCSNATANHTGGINSAGLRLLSRAEPGRWPLSSSLHNSLDATNKEKARERRGCVGCVGRTEQGDTLLMNILESSLLYEEEGCTYGSMSEDLKETGPQGYTRRLIPKEELV